MPEGAPAGSIASRRQGGHAAGSIRQGRNAREDGPIAFAKTEAATPKQGRREFLAAAAGGGAVLAAPNVSRAQTAAWRFQSAWPQRDIFHEFAQDYAKRVNDMAGGRLRLEVLAAGAVVGAFRMHDAVHSGALDGGHGVAANWHAKNKAFSLFGTSPPYFGDAHQLLGWYYYGGGAKLHEELLRDIAKADLVAFLTGPMPTQPLGWFKREIKKPEDLKRLKFRTVGLSADLFKELGATVTILPGGEIVPALERDLLDGAEFNNPSSDRSLGFPAVRKVYMLGSYHQNAECFEAIFNKTKFDALAGEQKAILRYAAESSSSDMFWKAQYRYTGDLAEMRQTQGVKTFRTPRAVLDAQLMAWDRLIETLSSDPFFKRVVASQTAWARRVGAYFLDNQSPAQHAFDHYFVKRR